ncbi:MAG: lipid II flippase family protein [Candidatus Xenobia bacterium]
MSLSLLADHRLLFIVVVAGFVAMLQTVNVAARPAAMKAGRAALALTVSQLFFMVTRFANLFYLPLLAVFVDRAVREGAMDRLYAQIQWVVVGAAAGTLASWLLLPTFVELYVGGIRSMEKRQSMIRVVLRLLVPSTWGAIIRCLRPPSLMGVQLGRLSPVRSGTVGVPPDFLVFNVAATAIWTVGPLCAMLASAQQPQYAATAVLLSGLVNAFAAIAFTIWVNPKAAVILDQALAQRREAQDVDVTAVHLGAGNFVGAILGLLVLAPGTAAINRMTHAIGSAGGDLSGSLWMIAGINALMILLASTSHASRVSAVLTKRVATAVAMYSVFELITRIASQIYAPILGSIRDHAVDIGDLGLLDHSLRLIILGAAFGALAGWLLMPTFVEIYNHAIVALDRLHSVPALFIAALHPRYWPRIVGVFRRPSLFGIRLQDLQEIPRGFLWGNVLVSSIYTIGVLSAIAAGAQLSHELARTATLLSSVVNGFATITLSLVVDPMSAMIVDQCVSGKRPPRHVYAMAVFLIGGTLVGTLLSELLFPYATWIIVQGAKLIGAGFGH